MAEKKVETVENAEPKKISNAQRKAQEMQRKSEFANKKLAVLNSKQGFKYQQAAIRLMKNMTNK